MENTVGFRGQESLLEEEEMKWALKDLAFILGSAPSLVVIAGLECILSPRNIQAGPSL